MSAEDQIKETVGGLYSQIAPRPHTPQGIPMGGGASVEQQLSAVQNDIRQLYAGLLLIGGQIDHLNAKVSPK